jgi:hypothetical protein
VPIIAIFTKFDLFVQFHLKDLLKGAGNGANEDQLEEQAKQLAMTDYEKEYKAALMEMPFPPDAVLQVSEGVQIIS